MSGSTSRLSSGGRASSRPQPPSFQWPSATCGGLGGRLDPGRDRRARRRRGRRAAARPCGSRAPGRRSVSSSSAVAGTSRIDLTPAATTSAGVFESAPRSAEMSRLAPSRGGRRRCRRCPWSRIPAARRDGRACRRPWSRRSRPAPRRPRGRAGPALRASAPRRSAPSSSVVKPDADLAVEHADRCGHGPPARTAASHAQPDLQPLPGGEAVRDERRLERDDRAALGEGVGDLGRDPSCRECSHAGRRSAPPPASPSSMPPTRNPAASASPAPVVSTTSRRARPVRLDAVDDGSRRRRASRPRSRRAGRRPAPPRSAFPKTTSGAERVDALAERLDAERPDRAQRREVDADLRARAPAPAAAARDAASAIGAAQQRVAGQMAARRSPSTQAGRAPPARSRARRRGRWASSASRRAARATTTVPVPASTSGPATSTRAVRSSSASIRPAGSAARLPTNRASPPSSATHAATFAAWPPGPSARLGRACPCPRRSGRRAARPRRGADRRACRSRHRQS